MLSRLSRYSVANSFIFFFILKLSTEFLNNISFMIMAFYVNNIAHKFKWKLKPKSFWMRCDIMRCLVCLPSYSISTMWDKWNMCNTIIKTNSYYLFYLCVCVCACIIHKTKSPKPSFIQNTILMYQAKMVIAHMQVFELLGLYLDFHKCTILFEMHL